VCSNLSYNNCYQPPSKQHHKPRSLCYSTNLEVYIPSFFESKNVKAYLEWQMKVDKIFECHQVDEYRRFSMAMLSFKNMSRLDGHRQNDVRVDKKIISIMLELVDGMYEKKICSTYC